MSASSPIEPVDESPVELEQAVESPAEPRKNRTNWFAPIIAIIVLAGVVAGALATTGYWRPHGRVEAKLKLNVPQTVVGSDPDSLPDPQAVKRFRDDVVEKLKSRNLINLLIQRLARPITEWEGMDDKPAWLEARLYVEEKGDTAITVGLRGIVNPDEDKLILDTLVKCLIESTESTELNRRAKLLKSLREKENKLSSKIDEIRREWKEITRGVSGVVPASENYDLALKVCRDSIAILSTERLRIRVVLAGAKARVESAKKSLDSDILIAVAGGTGAMTRDESAKKTPGSDSKSADEIASLTAQLLFVDSELLDLSWREQAIVARQAEVTMIGEKLRTLNGQMEKIQADRFRLENLVEVEPLIQVVDETTVHH